MSGGVDSSVAAALLVQQGYQVTGMMLRLWSECGKEVENRCCTPAAMANARRVAGLLDIPFYAVDAQQVHFQAVVQDFLQGYQTGRTPNPCLECNRLVRWGFLRKNALAFGADFLATGHYARLSAGSDGSIQLFRAVDHTKDQSYVLHMLDQEQLAQTMLPLGEMNKPEVRRLAEKFGLPVATTIDSQDLCFLSGGDYRDFLSRHAPQVCNPGPMINRQGEQIGVHQGLAFYTIGQRKGIKIPSTMPVYVLEKDLETNTLMVGSAEELAKPGLVAGPIHWIAGAPPAGVFCAQVKTRYTAQPASALVKPLPDGNACVFFDLPLRDITPGQAAVFYQEELCLGGGLIQKAAG